MDLPFCPNETGVIDTLREHDLKKIYLSLFNIYLPVAMASTNTYCQDFEPCLVPQAFVGLDSRLEFLLAAHTVIGG